jgi:hypothetical protein
MLQKKLADLVGQREYLQHQIRRSKSPTGYIARLETVEDNIDTVERELAE